VVAELFFDFDVLFGDYDFYGGFFY